MKIIKVMVLNAQDLFLFMDKHTHAEIPVTELTEIKWQLMSSSLFSNKSKEKCVLLGNTIRDAEADIVMVTEVGGPESLENFARFVLNDDYLPFCLPSNSDRGIDLGYLVRRTLPYEVRVTGHTDYRLPEPARCFSRDVLKLELLSAEKPVLITLLVHIKSKLDLRRKDFEGRTRRILEVKGLLEIFKAARDAHPDVPILVGGDMNGHAGERDTEEEFKAIYETTELRDIAHLAAIPDEDRFSYVYFTRGGNRFVQQIDYLFLEERWRDLIVREDCYFPRYRNINGVPLPIPQRMEQKNSLPSDHYPFLATLTLPVNCP